MGKVRGGDPVNECVGDKQMEWMGKVSKEQCVYFGWVGSKGGCLTVAT